MKIKRELEMEQYILSSGSVTMDELCRQFGVSINTVRRDVAALLKKGRIRKVYGGVQALESSSLIPYDVRSENPSDAKRAICSRAAEMVRDGDIIFIDSGTTTEHLIHDLANRKLTVITNNIAVIREGMAHDNIRLIVVPGEIHRKTHSITGEESAQFLSTMNTNIAFMAATGASLTGVTNSSALEYSIKKAAVSHTEKAVLLVTGNKFGVTSLFTYAQLNQFQTVITDDTLDPEYREKLEEKGINLDLVSAGKAEEK